MIKKLLTTIWAMFLALIGIVPECDGAVDLGYTREAGQE